MDTATVERRIGWVAWWTLRVALVAYSVLALLSFGGQIVVAPFLVPLQWLAARFSTRPWRMVFSALSGLIVGEVVWILGDLLIVGVVVGVGAGLLVFRTSGAHHRGRHQGDR
jgi:hypothetical protein